VTTDLTNRIIKVAVYQKAHLHRI